MATLLPALNVDMLPIVFDEAFYTQIADAIINKIVRIPHIEFDFVNKAFKGKLSKHNLRSFSINKFGKGLALWLALNVVYPNYFMELELLPLQFQQPLPTALTPATSLPLNQPPPPLPFIPFYEEEPLDLPLPSLLQRKVKRVKRVNRKRK